MPPEGIGSNQQSQNFGIRGEGSGQMPDYRGNDCVASSKPRFTKEAIDLDAAP